MELEAELGRVSVAVAKVQSMRAQGGDIHKAMVEGATISFLVNGLAHELRAGKGFRPSEHRERTWRELDLVVDRRDAAWYGDARFIEEGDRPLAHVEVSFRSKPDIDKLTTDLSRLTQTIAQSAKAHTKTWTALVVCGTEAVGSQPGSSPGVWAPEDVGKAIRHHGTSATSPLREVHKILGWWPAVDIIVLPSLSLTKTCVRLESGEEQMVWLVWPTAHREEDVVAHMRPLAFAREKLRNFLAMRAEGMLVDRALNPSIPRSAVAGARTEPLDLIAIDCEQCEATRCTWDSDGVPHHLVRRIGRPEWEWYRP